MAFSEGAVRLAGLATVLLGWRPREFWAATPAELHAIVAALSPEPTAPDAAIISELKERFPDG